MAETVKVPGIKQPLPRWAVFGGVGVTAVAIVVYYRKNQASSATAAADTSATGLASGGLPDSGLLAGDTSGAYTWDGTYGDPSDPYSLDSSTGQTYGNEGYLGGFGLGGQTGPGVSGQLGGPPFSNNAAWSAYAIQQLTATQQTSPSAITEALGLYLDGKALTVAQQDIVYSAQAVAGQVPVAGAGGFPPQIRTAAGGGKPKGGKTFASNPVKGLKATANHVNVLVTGTTGKGVTSKGGKTDLEITWDKSDHATGYQVSAVNVTAHRTALAPVTTTKTSYTVRGLAGGGTFKITVLAKPAEKGAQAATTEAKG